MGPESQTRTGSGRVLWLTWTILNFIPRTMASHWGVLNGWICDPVTMKSRTRLECLKHACLWLIWSSSWISPKFVYVFLHGNLKNVMWGFYPLNICMESLLLTAQMGGARFCFGSGDRALLCAAHLPSCVSFRNPLLCEPELSHGVTREVN